MKQTVTVAICLLVLGVFATSTFAGSALGLLRGYEDNVLEDEDFEAIAYFDQRTQGWLGVDLSQATPGQYVVPNAAVPTVLISMWNVQRVSYSSSSDVKNPTTNTFTAISATKVSNVTAGSLITDAGTGDTTQTFYISFVPLTGTEWTGLINAGLLPAAAKPTAVGSFGTMYDDANLDNSPSWIHPDLDEGTEADGVAFHPDDWDNDFATALGTKLWEFGYTGTGGVSQNAEFWSAQITNTTGTFFGPSSVTFLAGLNETYAHIAHPALLAHDGFNFHPTNTYQFELSGGIPFSTLKGDGFYQTDTDIMIRPTPEPASLALLALGLAAFGGIVYRRRRS